VDETANAADDWVRAHWPRAVVYARSLLRDRLAAEDVVQECFCNLLRKTDDYDLAADGVRLLMKSVTNACFNHNRRSRSTLSLHAKADEAGIDPRDEGARDPVREVLYVELEKAVAAALAELPENQRAAVELKGLGHTHGEIGEILNLTASNAGVLVHRGRQALARRLAPFLENKPDEQPGKRTAE
jgi:RNA polymerase sigma factor (sigma-70 family)